MADQNIYELCKEFFQKLFGDPAVAAQVASDPEGALAAYGITDYQNLDFREVVADSYHDYDLPYGSKDSLQSYASGGGGPASYPVKPPPSYAGGHQSPADAVAHVQYVTYAAYEQHPSITQEIVNTQQLFDNSDNRVFNVDNGTELSVDVTGQLDGAITVAPTNLNALGDQSAAVQGEDNIVNTGDGEVTNVEDVDGPVVLGDLGDGAVVGRDGVTAATAEGAVANTGDDNVIGTGDGDIFAASRGGEVTAATAEGAVAGGGDVVANTGQVEGVLAGGDLNAPVNTGQNSGVLTDGDIDGPVNTGLNSGLLADGEVRNAVIGDENQTANLDIHTAGGGGGISSASGGDASSAGGDASSAGGLSSGVGGNASGTGGNASSAGGNASASSGDASGGAGGGVGPINLSFGGGAAASTDIGGNVDNSALAGGGSADNVADNRVEDGSALATGGDAAGGQEIIEESFNNDRSFNEIEVEVEVDDSLNTSSEEVVGA